MTYPKLWLKCDVSKTLIKMWLKSWLLPHCFCREVSVGSSAIPVSLYGTIIILSFNITYIDDKWNICVPKVAKSLISLLYITFIFILVNGLFSIFLSNNKQMKKLFASIGQTIATVGRTKNIGKEQSRKEAKKWYQKLSKED